MSIDKTLNSIKEDRDTIRTKFLDLNLISNTSAKLDDLATASALISNVNQSGGTEIKNQAKTVDPSFSSSVVVKPDSGYTGLSQVTVNKVAVSYEENDDGSTTVYIGGKEAGETQPNTLQSKSVTPSSVQQVVKPDSGYYGLSQVTVGAIPSTYKNVANVTATAPDVLLGKKIVMADGTETTGTMPNNGNVDVAFTSDGYTIPKGYHDGSGTVHLSSADSIALDGKNIKSGVTIMGVEGLLDASGMCTTAVATGTTNLSSANAKITFNVGFRPDHIVAFVLDDAGGDALSARMAYAVDNMTTGKMLMIDEVSLALGVGVQQTTAYDCSISTTSTQVTMSGGTGLLSNRKFVDGTWRFVAWID